MRYVPRFLIGLLVLGGLLLCVLFAVRFQADSVRSQGNAAFETRLIRFCIAERLPRGGDTAVCEGRWWSAADDAALRRCDRTTATDEAFRDCLSEQDIHAPE